MNIDGRSAYGALIASWRTETSNTNHATNARKDYQSLMDVASAQTQNGVVSSGTNRLSAEMTQHLILANQQDESGMDVAKSRLPISVQHEMEDAVQNPGYANQRAREVGVLPELIPLKHPFPMNGATEAQMVRFKNEMRESGAQNERAQNMRTDFYNERLDAGSSGPELYAEMLEFKASMSDYNTFIDSQYGNPPGTNAQIYQDMATYLRGLIAEQKTLDASSTPSDDSTSA